MKYYNRWYGSVRFRIPPPHPTVVNPRIGEYVACIYGDKWFVGSVDDVCEDENDAEIKFMHPNGLAASFKWPEREDKLDALYENILCKIDVPLTKTGRTYHVLNQDEIHEKFMVVMEQRRRQGSDSQWHLTANHSSDHYWDSSEADYNKRGVCVGGRGVGRGEGFLK